MRTTRAMLAALLAAGSLTMAACGGGGEPENDAAPAAGTPSRATAPVPDTWPLTGLRVTKGSSVTRHPVYVLKMDNTASSAPQLGLSSADLVVEELVEGGVTRLAAFFYSTIPGRVGPVRSMRASDIGIVSPANGTMVTSGAAGVTISRIRKAGLAYVTEGSAGFARDTSRVAPYNLMADLGAVEKATRQKAARPDDYLPFGSGDLPAGPRVTSFSAQFSGGHTTQWAYRDGGYVNLNTDAAEGDEFPADTVLVLRVRVGDAGYLDPAGNPVPETQLTGTGSAMLFHGGRLVRGTWTKKGLDAGLRLSTEDGDLEVPPGRTWIELVPADGGDVVLGG